MAGFVEDRFKLFGDEVVSFAPLVIDQFLGGALERRIVGSLMTAEQRLHQVTACHAMNILARCVSPLRRERSIVRFRFSATVFLLPESCAGLLT